MLQFQNESKYETFHMKMSSACSLIFMQSKVKNNFALRSVLNRAQGKSEMAYSSDKII